jgi:hypothetical protein
MLVGSGSDEAPAVFAARFVPKIEIMEPGDTGEEAKLAALTTPPGLIWGVWADRFRASGNR